MSDLILRAPQGSPAWIRARMGIPTASQFSRIITKTGKLSGGETATKYLCELLAEWATGPHEDAEFGGSFWTERGTDLEPAARAFYELQRDASVEEVGFVWRDAERLVGCSPDWIIGDDGLGEIKCPAARTHIRYLLGGVDVPEYRAQVQGSLWVTGRAWCDFLSYHPGLPSLIVRVERDEEFIAKLAEGMEGFLDRLRAGRETLRSRGVTSWESRQPKFSLICLPCGGSGESEDDDGATQCRACGGSGERGEP